MYLILIASHTIISNVRHPNQICLPLCSEETLKTLIGYYLFFLLQDPIKASPEDIDIEVLSLISAAQRICPLHIVLERIVITRTGSVLACWQIGPRGSEPFDLRRKLQQALPRASRKQVLTDTTIFHTTLARIAAPLVLSPAGGTGRQEVNVALTLWKAAAAMTKELCATHTTIDVLW